MSVTVAVVVVDVPEPVVTVVVVVVTGGTTMILPSRTITLSVISLPLASLT